VHAVWSFWTKPWRARSGWSWLSEKHHLLAWILSVETARKHYPKTSLITDDAGANMLVDGIGLPFDSVSTGLNSLAARDPRLWMLGKLYAYRAQSQSFVHLDTDVILWKRLPAIVESAPVFAQNPDPFVIGASHYKPEQLQQFLTQAQGLVPREWEWSLSFGPSQHGANCGIMGGNHIEFIHYYAESAINIVEDTRNQAGWCLAGDKYEYNTAIEQFHLSACIEYHRNRPDSRYHAVEIRYLFDSFGHAFNPNIAAKAGFTHLITCAKQHKVLADRLEKRVKRDYPKQYERCIRFASKGTGSGR
jgi:hypothetical protein